MRLLPLLLAACAPDDPRADAGAELPGAAAAPEGPSREPVIPPPAADCGAAAPVVTWEAPAAALRWLDDGGVEVGEGGVTEVRPRAGPALWDLAVRVEDPDGDLAGGWARLFVEAGGDGALRRLAVPAARQRLEGDADACGTPALEVAFACAVEGTSELPLGGCVVRAGEAWDVAVQVVDAAGNASPRVVVVRAVPDP